MPYDNKPLKTTVGSVDPNKKQVVPQGYNDSAGDWEPAKSINNAPLMTPVDETGTPGIKIRGKNSGGTRTNETKVTDDGRMMVDATVTVSGVSTETTLAAVKAVLDDVHDSTNHQLKTATSLSLSGISTEAKQDVANSALGTIALKDFATQSTLSTASTTLTAIKDTAGIKKITDPLPAGTNNIGDVDIASVPADPFGTNSDVANANGSMSAKLRYLTTTGLAGMSSLPSGTNTVGGVTRTSKATWTVTQDSTANTAQTLVKSAVSGQKHYITGFEVNISGASSGADIFIQLKDGTTVKWKTIIGYGSPRGEKAGIIFNEPIQMSTNTAVNLTVDAGGTGVITTANLTGWTE